MTCFWNAILSKVKSDDMRVLIGSPSNPRDLVLALKRKNVCTKGVRWQTCDVPEQQLRENVQWIDAHDVNTIGNGYDCGTADPYLFLLCYLLSIRISHQYLRTSITYDPPGTVRYTIRFVSNHGHIS